MWGGGGVCGDVGGVFVGVFVCLFVGVFVCLFVGVWVRGVVTCQTTIRDFCSVTDGVVLFSLWSVYTSDIGGYTDTWMNLLSLVHTIYSLQMVLRDLIFEICYCSHP